MASKVHCDRCHKPCDDSGFLKLQSTDMKSGKRATLSAFDLCGPCATLFKKFIRPGIAEIIQESPPEE